ncbi:MAG: branched-chain-amino-acid transaminase [Planctomycetota bacterium]
MTQMQTDSKAHPAPGHADDPIAAYDGRQVWVDGTLKPAAEATVSVFDHGVLYGDGVFEGIRIYHGKVLKLRTHLNRLAQSAKSIKLKLPYSLDELFDATKETVAANGMDNGYIRLVVTRGPGTLGIDPVPCPRPCVFIIVAPLKLYPQEYYDHGLKLISSSFVRVNPQALSPRIKSLNYLNNILAKTEALEAGVFEAVMYNDQGYVAEATADNLFVVNGTSEGHPIISTPPLSAGCLEGVTRNLVIDLARAAGFEVREENLTRHDLYTADEMFLTGTGAEVIPVVDLDNRLIGPAGGEGQVGSTTKQLITAFREMVKDAPED